MVKPQNTIVVSLLVCFLWQARVAGSEVMRVMVETQQAIRTAVENLDDLQSLYKNCVQPKHRTMYN